MIVVDSAGPEPSEGHRALFAALVERYSSLRPAIGEALFSLWKPHLENWPNQVPPVNTVEEILRCTTLDYIQLTLPFRIDLTYGFIREVGWDDAMFNLNLVDWRVSTVSLDD